MNSTAFKEKLSHGYHALVEEEKVGNQFITRQFHVKGSLGDKDLGFTIGFNSEDQASILMMDKARLNDLNIAEGYTSEDILNIAQALLDGSYAQQLGHFWRKSRLVFNTSRGKLYAKLERGIVPKPYQKVEK
jgi:hypothetical protein